MSLFCGRDLCLSLCVYFLLSFLVAPPSCKILSEFSYGVSVNVIIFPSVDTVVNWGTAGWIFVLIDSKEIIFPSVDTVVNWGTEGWIFVLIDSKGLLVLNVEFFDGNTNLCFPLLDLEPCIRTPFDEAGFLFFFAARLTTNARINFAENLSISPSLSSLSSFEGFEASFDAGKTFPPGASLIISSLDESISVTWKKVIIWQFGGAQGKKEQEGRPTTFSI